MSVAELATKSDIAGTHTAIDNLRAEVKSDIELLRRDLVIKLGSISVIGVGVLLAAMRYMPVRP
jgi:hypothetical protein